MAPQAQGALGGHWALVLILGRRPCGKKNFMLEIKDLKGEHMEVG